MNVQTALDVSESKSLSSSLVYVYLVANGSLMGFLLLLFLFFLFSFFKKKEFLNYSIEVDIFRCCLFFFQSLNLLHIKETVQITKYGTNNLFLTQFINTLNEDHVLEPKCDDSSPNNWCRVIPLLFILFQVKV